MKAKGTDQASGYGVYRGGTTDRGSSGRRLRREVLGVVKVARTLDPVTYPGAAEAIRGPRSSSYQALLAAARALLENIAPVKATIIAHGAAADFDETIQGLIADVEEATGRKASGRAEQSGGTAGLLAKAKEGVTQVKRLDAIMTHILKNDPSLQAAWKSASRIQRDPVPAKPAAAAAPAPAPVPAPAH
jgi:hypothetical protein